MSNARRVEISLEAYHGDKESISHSGLEMVIDNVERYHYERIAGNPQERKLHFEQGQNLEDALMRPGECGNGVILIPNEVLAKGGAKSGSAWHEFKREHEGKVLVKETDLLYHQIEAVKRHEHARQLVEANGRLQETIYWTDDETGVACRLRMDKIIAGESYIVDLKTDRSECSVQECVKAIEYWGYDRQAEFYRRGAKELYGVEIPWVFIFVAKAPPFQVQVIYLDDEWYPEAKAENDKGLRSFARCKESGVWLPEMYGKMIRVKPSRNRGKYKHDWEMSSHGERESEPAAE